MKNLICYSLTLFMVFAQNIETKAQYGNVLNFDGVNDFARVDDNPSHPALQLSIGTIEAWIKTSARVSGYRGIVVKQIAYGLLLNDNVLVAYDWSTQYCMGTTGGDHSTGRDLADGSWHHVAMSFNSGVTNGTFIYVDGILRNTSTYVVCSNGHELTIGTGSTGGLDQFFNGLIDEVRVWNVARSEAQINSTMNMELIGNETGLVAYYKFNQGTAGQNNAGITTLNDLVGPNTNNGTLYNFALSGTTSNWVSSNAVLPVELLSFNATPESDAVKLHWQTANEENNKGFQVEKFKASDNRWEVLGFVPAHGKASAYDYVDNTHLSESNISYYRLRQQDNNGAEAFSKVVSVSLTGSKGLVVYPSIVSDGFLNIDINEHNKAILETQYTIFNLLGQQVQNGITGQRIYITALPQGTYILKVGTNQVKFVKS